MPLADNSDQQENTIKPAGERGGHVVTAVRHLTDSTFILRFTRNNLEFRAGQRILAGIKGDLDQRDYSIYSGENDDHIEILVKEIPVGNVSARLRQCNPGDLIDVNGPFGTFGPEDYEKFSRKLVFIATGTGISPFHSMVRSWPGIDYILLHGVRFSAEAYEKYNYEKSRYILCTSEEKSEGRQGRVTGYLHGLRLTPGMLFYLCGNGNMIYEVSHLLKKKGIPSGNIFSEIYF